MEESSHQICQKEPSEGWWYKMKFVCYIRLEFLIVVKTSGPHQCFDHVRSGNALGPSPSGFQLRAARSPHKEKCRLFKNLKSRLHNLEVLVGVCLEKM